MPLLLIDGDQIVFKAAAACEKEVRWDEQNHVLYSNEQDTWSLVMDMINRLLERFDPDDTGIELVICFSGTQPYFREQVAPGYKAGRGRKPLCYALVRERVENTYPCSSKPGLEADDVMGILATKPANRKLTPIIVSQDKDMKTIPAKVWNGKDLVEYSEEQADGWHMYQTLVGDVCDGFKGCPGVGPVKAAKLLDGHLIASAWPIVVKAYEKARLTEADALQQARLARILRWSDWDDKKKEPILWNPVTTA